MDGAGNTALHMAAELGNTGQVGEGAPGTWHITSDSSHLAPDIRHLTPGTLQACLLLKHHADHHLKNHLGQEPLDVAVGRCYPITSLQ